jgi:hypothetical protein
MGEENREVILRGETLPAKQEVVFAPDYILDIDPHTEKVLREYHKIGLEGTRLTPLVEEPFTPEEYGSGKKTKLLKEIPVIYPKGVIDTLEKRRENYSGMYSATNEQKGKFINIASTRIRSRKANPRDVVFFDFIRTTKGVVECQCYKLLEEGRLNSTFTHSLDFPYNSDSLSVYNMD